MPAPRKRYDDFQRFFLARAKEGLVTPAPNRDVLSRDLAVFADREVSGLLRLDAASRIVCHLPAESLVLPHGPGSTIDRIYMHIEEHPRYAFDQDAIWAITGTGMALGVDAGFDPTPIDISVRALGRFGSVPRSIARMVFEQMYQSATGEYADLRDPIAEMGAQADIVPRGIRMSRALRQLF